MGRVGLDGFTVTLDRPLLELAKELMRPSSLVIVGASKTLDNKKRRKVVLLTAGTMTKATATATATTEAAAESGNRWL